MARRPSNRKHRSKQRDANGRFVRGSQGGPGNPAVKHMAELQAAVRQAVEPRMLEGVLKRLTRMALEGDVGAARVLLDRVLGKPRTEAASSTFALPPIETAADIPAAFAALLDAAATGGISADDATRYATVLELTRRSMETAELEVRLKRVEERQGLASSLLPAGNC